jgi:hypothetical protein
LRLIVIIPILPSSQEYWRSLDHTTTYTEFNKENGELRPNL